MRLALPLALLVALVVPSSVSAQGFALTAFQPPSIGHQGAGSCLVPDPVTTNLLIDDWLGYGYLRNQPGGSPYGGYSSGVYTPCWPGLFNHSCPLWFPLRPVFCLLGAMSHPWHAPPYAQSPYQRWQQPNWVPQQWQRPYPWHTPAPGMSPYWPQNPCPPDPCAQPVCPPIQCQPVCPPVAVQVPVTTCRPVTVDDGYYQTIWVSRPRTIMVPETRWQTQWVQPNAGSSMPTWQPGCSGEPCLPDGTPYSPSVPQPAPDTSYNPGPVGGGIFPNGQRIGTATAPMIIGPNGHPVPVAGDIFGDHELSTIPRTGQIPAMPQSFSASVRTVPATAVRRFPVAVQPQRRYSSSVH